MGNYGQRDVSVPEGINLGRLLRYSAPRLWLVLAAGLICAVVGLLWALTLTPEYSGASKLEVLPDEGGVSLNTQLPAGGLSASSLLGGGEDPADVNRMRGITLSREVIHLLGLEVEVIDPEDSFAGHFRQRVLSRVGIGDGRLRDRSPVRLSNVSYEDKLAGHSVTIRSRGGGGFDIVDREGLFGARGATVASGSSGQAVNLKGLRFTVDYIDPAQGASFDLSLRKTADWLADFRNRMVVDGDRGFETMFTVRFTHEYPDVVRDVLTTLVDRYSEWLLGQRGISQQQQLDYLRQELARREKELDVLQDRYYAYRSENDYVQFNTQAELLLTQVAEYDAQINEMELTRRSAQDMLAALKSGDIDSFLGGSFLANRQDLQLGEMQQRLSQLRSEREGLLTQFTEKHSRVQAVDQQIAQLTSDIESHLRGTAQQLSASISDLRGQQKQYLDDSQDLPQAERALFDLRREYDAMVTLVEFLRQQRFEAELTKASLTPNLRYIDAAEVSEKPVRPKLGASTVFGGIMGVVIGLLALLFTFLGHSQVFDEEDAAEAGTLIATLTGSGWRDGLPLLAAAMAERGSGAGILLTPTPGASVTRLGRELLIAAQSLGRQPLALLDEGPPLASAAGLGIPELPAEASLADDIAAVRAMRSPATVEWLERMLERAELVLAAPPSVTDSSLGQQLANISKLVTVVAVRGVTRRRALADLTRSLELAGVQVAGVVLADERALAPASESA